MESSNTREKYTTTVWNMNEKSGGKGENKPNGKKTAKNKTRIPGGGRLKSRPFCTEES